MTMRRKHALFLALIVLAVPLLCGSYLWFKAALRVAELPKPVLSTKAGVQTKDPGTPQMPGAVCFDPTRRVEVPCPASNPLLEAAEIGDADQVERLLGQRTDRKALNEALFAAAESAPRIVSIDNKGFEVKPDEAHGFHYARIAKLLLGKGASIEARDEAGRTPLIAAAGRGEDEVVKLLLEQGADIEAKDKEGQTALITAACNCPVIDMPSTYDSVRILLENGANIEARDKQGGTALMAAARWGRSDNAQLLLDKGASIDVRDNYGNTAFLIAASGGGYPTADAAELLLTRGANIEARNNNGDTALILAASDGGAEDVRIVKMLLNHGANRQARNKRGQTALDLARKKDRTKTAALLRSAATESH